MSACQIQSSSTYTSGIKMQYISVAECTAKTIGTRLDNRTSSAHKGQTEVLQAKATLIEDLYNMDMGTGILGGSVFINVAEFVSDRLCISDETGTILYHSIIDALHNGKRVNVSFENIADLSSAFFESAFGRLYLNGFTDRELKRRIIICGLSEDDKFIFDRVIDRVRDFLKDPVRFEIAMNDVLGEDND
jgi:hypothetical protein